MKIASSQLSGIPAGRILLVLAVLLLSRAAAQAASDSWTGATDSNFSGLNWNTSGSVPPTNGDSLVFASGTGAGGATLSDNYFTSGSSVAGISFLAGAVSFTISPATAGTNGFTLTGGITNSSTALQTINDLIVLSATSTVTMTTGGGNVTLGGIISGAGGGLTTAGTGVLTLSAANTFSGTMKLGISTGTVALGTSEVLSGTTVTSSAIGTGTLNLNAGTLVSTSGTQSIDNVIVISGNATVGGTNAGFTNALTLNSVGGSFTNSGGNNNLTNNDPGGLTLAGPIFLSESLVTGRTLTISGTYTTTITGSIANASGGAGIASGLTYNSSQVTGILILSNGNSTFSGSMTLAGSGTLEINADDTVTGGVLTNGPLGTGTFAMTSGKLLALNSARSIDNAVAINGSLTIAGVNAITFNNSAGSITNLANNNNTLTNNDTAGITFAGPIYLSSSTGTTSTLSINGSGTTTITGSIANANGGAGTPSTLNSNGSSVMILSNGNSTFSGSMIVTSGTLEINAAETLSGAVVTKSAIGTGTFALRGGAFFATLGNGSIDNITFATNTTTIVGTTPITFNQSGGFFSQDDAGNGSLTNNDTGLVTLAGPVYLDNSAAHQRILTIAGSGTTVISGSIASATVTTAFFNDLKLSSSSLLILTNGNSTYSGTTIVNSGTLVISANDTVVAGAVTNGAIGTGTLNLNGGAIQASSGTARTVDNITILTANSTIAGADALTFNASAGSFTNSGGNSNLTNNDAAMVTLAGPVYISEVVGTGHQFKILGSGTTTISGSIANANGAGTAGELILNNTSQIILSSGLSTYSGTTLVTTGTLVVSANDTVAGGVVTNGPLGTGTLELNGGAIQASSGTARTIDNATLLVNNSTVAGADNLTFNSLSGSFVNSGGSRTLTVNNSGTTTFAASIYLSETAGTARTLTINGSGNVVISGTVSTPAVSGSLAVAGSSTNSSITGILTGAVTLTVGGGFWTDSGTSINTGNTVTENGYSFTASTILTGGTLALGVDSTPSGVGATVTNSALGTGALDFKGGTLQAAGGNRIIANAIGIGNVSGDTITGSNNLTLNGLITFSGGQTLTDNSSGTTTYAGGIAIRGNDGKLDIRTITLAGSGNTMVTGSITNGVSTQGVVNFAGTGTTTLANNNTYTGGGNLGIASGTVATTVKLGNANGLGFGGLTQTAIGGVTVNGGATLDLNGQTGVNKQITLSSTNGSVSLINSNTSATANIGNGVTAIVLASAIGSGSTYSAPPVVTISSPVSGTTATGSASLGVSSMSFTLNPTTTVYSAAPSVTITGGGGFGATATANLTSGTVSSITITNAGYGFSTAPTISFSGGTITTAGTNPTGSGNATNFSVGALEMTLAGSGYTSTPTVSFDGGGSAAATATVSNIILSASTSANLNPIYNIGGNGNLQVDAVISGGTGSTLTKIGSGTTIFNAVNTYTGTTAVNQGTLIVNGSIASSPKLTVAAGATLAGFGTVGIISGAGKVAPADAPSILTATQVDPSTGMSFTFDMTQLTPTYGTASNSGNDVLRLTGATPLAFTMTSGNVITIDFSGATLADGQIYQGGIFSDAGVTDIGTPTFVYTGTGAFTVVYDGMVTIPSAAFAGGSVTNGTEMQFEIQAVPEPGTYALVFGGFGMLAGFRRLRRRGLKR